jgi:hypothetical protein
MNIVIQSSIHTLEKSKALLHVLNNEQLSDCSVPPYNSCIGSHLRHILDFYDCILIEGNKVDLTGRKRQVDVETNCDVALKYLKNLIEKLKNLDLQTIHRMVLVTDDLGLGKVDVEYTYPSLLAQANSHAIHHYAIINYILNRLDITIMDESFGYNPTTPKPEANFN